VGIKGGIAHQAVDKGLSLLRLEVGVGGCGCNPTTRGGGYRVFEKARKQTYKSKKALRCVWVWGSNTLYFVCLFSRGLIGLGEPRRVVEIMESASRVCEWMGRWEVWLSRRFSQ
jgi:hypothetical protein